MCWYHFPKSIWCPWTRFQYRFGDRTTSSGPMAFQKIFAHKKWPKMTIFGSILVQTPQKWFPKTKFIWWPDQSFRMSWYRFPWSIGCPWTRFQYCLDDRTTSDGIMASLKSFSHTENTQKWPYLAPKGLVRKYTHFWVFSNFESFGGVM